MGRGLKTLGPPPGYTRGVSQSPRGRLGEVYINRAGHQSRDRLTREAFTQSRENSLQTQTLSPNIVAIRYQKLNQPNTTITNPLRNILSTAFNTFAPSSIPMPVYHSSIQNISHSTPTAPSHTSTLSSIEVLPVATLVSSNPQNLGWRCGHMCKRCNLTGP